MPSRLASVLIFALLCSAFALPLSAVAQPAADGTKPAPLSELTVTARKSTELSELTVTGACALPRNSGWTNAMFDAPPNAKNPRTEPSPGTREWLENTVAMFEQDKTFSTAHAPKMDTGLARATETQFQVIRLWVRCRGPLKSIKFLHVSAAGYDDYAVEFENGTIEWEVAPLDARQAAHQSAIQYFYPQPATKQFDDLLKSIERGRPNYANLTPDLASTVQAQWSTLQKSFKDWGGLGFIYFLRQGDDGSYLYLVSFRHRWVVWEVVPLDDNGKLASLKYAEASSDRPDPPSRAK